jgi:hypothetical protein
MFDLILLHIIALFLILKVKLQVCDLFCYTTIWNVIYKSLYKLINCKYAINRHYNLVFFIR